MAVALRAEPIRVRLKAENPCTAAGCETPASAALVYLSSGWRTLEMRIVCLGHAVALRALGGCLTFPLGAEPSMERLTVLVNEEIARRQRPTMFMYTNNTGSTFNFTWG